MTPTAPDPADPARGFRALGEDDLWSGWLLRLSHGRFVDPAGQPFERDIVHHPGAVAVVAVDDRGTAWLVRQYRPAVGRALLEIPAGTRDVDGEPPEATARRELIEEAGLHAGRLEELARVYNSPGYCDQLTIVFLATDLRPVPTDRGGVEEHWMTVEGMALAEVADRVADGTLVDSTTVLGLRLAADALARRR